MGSVLFYSLNISVKFPGNAIHPHYPLSLNCEIVPSKRSRIEMPRRRVLTRYNPAGWTDSYVTLVSINICTASESTSTRIDITGKSVRGLFVAFHPTARPNIVSKLGTLWLSQHIPA